LHRHATFLASPQHLFSISPNVQTKTMLLVLVLAVTASQVWGLDLVQTLVRDPEESQLVKYVTQAGLASALSSGTYTIFAPTDAAFNAVPNATLASLSADTAALGDLLKYHVIQGSVMSDDVRNEMTVTTLAGEKLRLNVYTHNNVVTAEGVPLTAFNKTADNGVIHTAARVIMPPTGSVVDTVVNSPDFSTLLSAVQKTGLADALKVDRLTVFAPTNEAFANLDSGDLQKLLDNPVQLLDVLTYHVIDHTLYSAGLYDRELPHSADTHHDRLWIEVRSESGVYINNVAHVTQADISTTNGVIHVIDRVLIPARVAIWLRFGGVG